MMVVASGLCCYLLLGGALLVSALEEVEIGADGTLQLLVDSDAEEAYG